MTIEIIRLYNIYKDKKVLVKNAQKLSFDLINTQNQS